MATKTIVRYHPPSRLVGERVITVADMEREGVFTQTANMAWRRESGFWLDADTTPISAETITWIENNAYREFTVERQEIPDPEPAPEPEDPPAEETPAPEPSPQPVAGEQPEGAGTPGATTGR